MGPVFYKFRKITIISLWPQVVENRGEQTAMNPALAVNSFKQNQSVKNSIYKIDKILLNTKSCIKQLNICVIYIHISAISMISKDWLHYTMEKTLHLGLY